MIIDMREIE